MSTPEPYRPAEVIPAGQRPAIPPGASVHVHHHYPPPAAPAAPPQPDILTRAAPWAVLGVFGALVAGLLVLILVIAAPVLMALLGSLVAILIAVAAAVGMLALMALAISASLRNMREGVKPPRKGRKR